MRYAIDIEPERLEATYRITENTAAGTIVYMCLPEFDTDKMAELKAAADAEVKQRRRKSMRIV